MMSIYSRHLNEVALYVYFRFKLNFRNTKICILFPRSGVLASQCNQSIYLYIDQEDFAVSDKKNSIHFEIHIF